MTSSAGSITSARFVFKTVADFRSEICQVLFFGGGELIWGKFPDPERANDLP